MTALPARALLHLTSGLALAFALGPAAAASPEDARAAKDTLFEGVRLLGDRGQDQVLTALGVHLAYVETDTQLGAGGMYRCGGTWRNDALSTGPAVTAALQYLPAAPLVRLRLRYVVLCDGVFDGDYRVAGTAVPALDLVMLDIKATSAQLMHTALHEVYHLLEYRFGGIDDAAWLAEFGDGYDHRYTGLLRTSAVGGGKTGFINEYAQSAPHEDRAELFAFLLIEPDAVASQIRRAGDRVLLGKADYVVDKCQRLAGIELPFRGP